MVPPGSLPPSTGSPQAGKSRRPIPPSSSRRLPGRPARTAVGWPHSSCSPSEGVPMAPRLVSLAFPWLPALAVLLVGVSILPAQERDEDDPFLPGLVARFQDGKGNEATRVEHRLALHQGESSPDARLAEGDLRVT